MTRILLVEDEESFSDPLSYMLRKEGYEVSVAETGPDALADFDRSGADLVLLDADPLLNIRNTQRIRAVFANGRYLNRAALDSLLEVANRVARAKEKNVTR